RCAPSRTPRAASRRASGSPDTWCSRGSGTRRATWRDRRLRSSPCTSPRAVTSPTRGPRCRCHRNPGELGYPPLSPGSSRYRDRKEADSAVAAAAEAAVVDLARGDPSSIGGPLARAVLLCLLRVSPSLVERDERIDHVLGPGTRVAERVVRLLVALEEDG